MADSKCSSASDTTSEEATQVTSRSASLPRKGPEVPEPGEVLILPCTSSSGRYIIKDNLRRVAPYLWTYNTYCKERWRGRKLVDIFESEFREKPIEYYKKAMRKGTVAVNGEFVDIDYIVKNGDLISHSTHRHEPPVTPDPIGVIHEDETLIVINKPSGVPVHQAGRYNFNCVLEIMKADRGMTSGILYPCNRLDRLTSGLMFVAKSAQGAEDMRRQIAGRTVRKEYVARVMGRFPDGEVVCDQPILQISPKVGLNRVRANGKSARTVFKRLAYYPPRAKDSATTTAWAGADNDINTSLPCENKEGYSIVRAMPVTGRTHQIRVHLQFLGHPVQNDPIYANRRVWGFNLGFNDSDGSLNTDDDIITRLSRMGKDEVADAVAYHDEMVDKYHRRLAEKMSGEVCEVCETPLYTDPGNQELSLWLHSLRYEDIGGSWHYISPLPAWAMPPEGYTGPTEVGSMTDLVKADDEDKTCHDVGNGGSADGKK